MQTIVLGLQPFEYVVILLIASIKYIWIKFYFSFIKRHDGTLFGTNALTTVN